MSAAALAAAPAVLVSNADAQNASERAQPLVQGPMTPPQARAASVGGVAIYFGDGIQDVDLTVDILREHGVPAIGITGAAAGQLFLLVDGRPSGRYTQRDIDRASLIQIAQQLYRDRMAVTETPRAPRN